MSERWSSDQSYSEDWSDRNINMLQLLRAPEEHTFTEYGCGPFTPFKNLLKDHVTVHLYDICKWDQLDNNIVDFNQLPLQDLIKSDIAVMSGVIEYLDHPNKVLNHLSKYHKYLLISYQPVTYDRRVEDRKQKSEFKLHLTDHGFRRMLNKYGKIRRSSTWFAHNLFLLEFKNGN